MKIFYSAILVVLLLSSTTMAKRAMTVEDLWTMKRIGDFCLSPDEKWIAFSLTDYQMETNKYPLDTI